MSKDDANERAAARKLLAKQLRRQAYLQAKERHAKDPKVIAMKEAMKQKRREVYQQAKEKAKEQRKAVSKAEKTQRAQQHAAKRAAADDALRSLIQKGSAGPVASKVHARAPAEDHDAEASTSDVDLSVTLVKKSSADSYGPN
jgi:hypothetical protein